MKTNGGYVILDLADTQNVYAQAQNCLLVNKPVMVYDNTQVYYADSIILDGTNIVLTKGGKTITIANDNTITTSGDIQNHLYCNTITASFDDEDEESGFMYITIYSNEKIENINDLKAYIDNYNSNNKFSTNGYQIADQYLITAIYNAGVDVYQYTNNNDEDKQFTFDENNMNFKSIQLF